VHAGAWILLLVGLLLFLILGDAPERTRFWDALFDAGHTPLFGLVALSLLGLLRIRTRPDHGSRTWWTAFVVTLVVGAATECLQVFQANREASIEDFLRDIAGAGALLLLVAAVPWGAPGAGPIRTRRGRLSAAAVAMVLLVAAGAHLAMTAALYAARDRAFPTLFALDGSWWERRLVEPSGSTLTPASMVPRGLAATGELLARLDLEPGTYPGIAFDEPYPDWRGYRRLVFAVVSDLDRPLSLVVRVHDAAHDQRTADRFNRSLVIHPGINRVAIPIDEIRMAPDRREMDLRRIRGVILFAYRLVEPTHVYLGALRLE